MADSDSTAMSTEMSTEMSTVYCFACGNRIDSSAGICRYCGAIQKRSVPAPVVAPETVSDKRILPAALLLALLGILGAHRFYAGKTGTAILMICTLGGLGIWWLVDAIMLLTGNFRDNKGNKITEWT